MLNLNRSWVQKQGDFFVESPIILFAAVIWFLRIYDNGRYCTFPHAIEFLNKRYEDIFPILTSYPELENYLSPFMDAWLGALKTSSRPDSIGQNSAFPHDFAPAILGHVGR